MNIFRSTGWARVCLKLMQCCAQWWIMTSDAALCGASWRVQQRRKKKDKGSSHTKTHENEARALKKIRRCFKERPPKEFRTHALTRRLPSTLYTHKETHTERRRRTSRQAKRRPWHDGGTLYSLGFLLLLLPLCMCDAYCLHGWSGMLVSLSLSLSPLVLDSLLMTSGRRRRRRPPSSMCDPPDARVVAGLYRERGRKKTNALFYSISSLSLSPLVVWWCCFASWQSPSLFTFCCYCFASLLFTDTIRYLYGKQVHVSSLCLPPSRSVLALIQLVFMYVVWVGLEKKKEGD